MSHDDQGQSGARRVQSAGFLFGAREASRRRRVPWNQPKFPFWCNKTKTAWTAGRRSSPSPPQRHDQRLFAHEDYFCQDRMYYLSPCKSCRCGIPSRSYLGRGPRRLYIGLSHHHWRGAETRACRAPHQLKNTSPLEACSSL